MDTSDLDRALLSELARGAQKTFDNAEALYYEAKALGAAGALCRALFLHQISLEECAKIEMIGVWATSLLMGLPADGKKIGGALGNHARKNRTNAYMLDTPEPEREAIRRGDWKAALDAFKKRQGEFHATSNDAKNASLYVDLRDGQFVAPIDRITREMLDEIADRNESFLSLTHPKLQMLLRWESAPESMQQELSEFISHIKAWKDNPPDDPVAALETLLEIGRRAMKNRSTKAGSA